MEMLDACRTVVPDESWKMMKLELMRGVAKTNAVSHAGNEILKIKKEFEELGIWRPQELKGDAMKLKDYVLQLVKTCKGNFVVNKLNLVYAVYLNKLISQAMCLDESIVLQSQSHVLKVKYDKAIKKLYDATYNQ